MTDSARIDDARTLLARAFGPTRLARAASLSSPGHDVFLKIETELPTGSFKVRGALYALSVAVRDGLKAKRDDLKVVPYNTTAPRAVRDDLKASPYNTAAPRAARDDLKAIPHNTAAPPAVRDDLKIVPYDATASHLVGDDLQVVPALREVVCASTGNHGAAVAWAAQQFSVRATVFLPAGSNTVKTARILALGARIVETAGDLTASIDAAQAYADRAGAFFLNDASDPHVPAGAGTIGLEILEQQPEVDTIYVPMGDTALIRGIASAVRHQRRSVNIIGVVAERAAAYQRSWQNARLRADSRTLKADDVVYTDTCDTIADGLAVRRPLAPNVAAIRELVTDVVAVSEEEMIAAIRWLRDREQTLAEPAGAAATAAFLQRERRVQQDPVYSTADYRIAHESGVGRVLADPPRTTVLLVTGGNIAPAVLSAVQLSPR